MLRARASGLLAAAILAAVPASVRADGPEPLRYDLAADLSITAGAAMIFVLSEVFDDRLGPDSCRWCTAPRLDSKIRERLVWDEEKSARTVSDVLAFGVIPAALAGHALLASNTGDAKDGWLDVLFMVQAAAIAVDLTQVTKIAVGRQRPFARYGNYGNPDRRPETDDNWSFFSGHAAYSFSLAAAAGMVSTLREQRSAPWVWAAGMTAAAAVAYFRMAGDMHYFTDVLTGAAIGTAVGAGVPWLLHRPRGGAKREDGVSVMPTLGGIVVVF